MPWTFYNSSGEALTSFGPVALTDLDIDGGTAIGEAVVGADLFIADNGAGGTNVKVTATEIATFIGSAVTREGGQTSEATSTSTSAADLLTSSTLAIAATTPFMFISSNRKTTGATDISCVGLKLNSTVVAEALDDASHNSKYVWGGRNDANAGDGGSVVWSGSRITNYRQSVYGDGVESPSGAGTGGGSIGGVRLNLTANSPTATITAVVLRTIVGNAAITQGSDELHVYTYASS